MAWTGLRINLETSTELKLGKKKPQAYFNLSEPEVVELRFRKKAGKNAHVRWDNFKAHFQSEDDEERG